MIQHKTNQAQVAMLRAIRGFTHLPDVELANLSGQLTWRRIEPGKALIFHEEDDNSLFLICQGTARAIIYADNGKEITYEEYHAGSFVGEVSAIDGKPRLTHVVAVTETIVASMDVRMFSRMMQDYPRLASEVAIKMCETIRQLSTRVYELSSLPASKRIELDIYRTALRNSDDGISAVIDTAPRHAEIASRTNTQRESVTKHLSKLRKLGVIVTCGRRMEVPNIGAIAP